MFLCLQCVVETTVCVCFGAAVGSLTMHGPSRWPATERRGILIRGRAFNCTIPKCSYIYSVWWKLCCTSFWSCCPLWQITRLADSIISNLDKCQMQHCNLDWQCTPLCDDTKCTISCGKKSQRYLSGIAEQKPLLKVATGWKCCSSNTMQPM